MAFVDIGVHQDGLVHVSAHADRFVKDLRDVVRIRVVEVDAGRKRIVLSMRGEEDERPGRPAHASAPRPAPARKAEASRRATRERGWGS